MKLLLTAICLLSLPISIQAAEKVVAEINVNALPASCINLSSGQVVSPQLADGEFIDDYCLDNGFEYYVEPRTNSTFNTIDAANADSFAKDLQFGDFEADFPGVSFEEIDESVLDFYFSGSSKGKGKGKGKSSFFRIGLADFGIYQTVSADGELHQGKIRKLDDDNIQVIAFVDNIAPELSFVDLSRELTIAQPIELTFEELFEGSDASDQDGDSLSFIFEGSSLSVSLNGSPINIGDRISAGDTIAVTPDQLGNVSLMLVSVTDEIEKSSVVEVNATVISKIAAIKNEIEVIETRLRKLITLKKSRRGAGRQMKILVKQIQITKRALNAKKQELKSEERAQEMERQAQKVAEKKRAAQRRRRSKKARGPKFGRL